MPLMEFECRNCGHVFETLVEGEGAVVKCKKCDSKKLVRLFSSFGFRRSSGSFVSCAGSSLCSSCTSTTCSGCKG